MASEGKQNTDQPMVSVCKTRI